MINLKAQTSSERRAGLLLAVSIIVILGSTSCENSTRRDYGLPLLASLGSCPEDAILEPPSGCAWSQSVDAIVWGTIKKVDLIKSPAYIKSSGKLVDKCDGTTNKAMVIVVQVENEFLGEAGDEVTVYVGQRQVEMFYPRPLPGNDGKIEWVYGGSEEGKPLGPGMQVGMAIHWNEENSLWSLMGEPMFSVEEDASGSEKIVFQKVLSECDVQSPVVFNGLELDQLGSAIASFRLEDCPEEASERRQRIETQWGTVPDSYFAAVCMPSGDSGDENNLECYVDADCAPFEKCVDGFCQQN